MHTRLNRAWVFGLLFGLAASAPAFAAEVVDWPTYYPSPYGDYRRLNTTENASLGTQANAVVVLASGGGNVGIGSAAPAQLFDVRSPAGVANSTMTATLVGANGWGVQVGGFKDAGGALQAAGGIQAYQTGGAATGPLALNPGGSFVTIGGAANTQNLTVRGAGLITFDRGGNTGPYKVAKAADNYYYAVFAPG